MRHALEKKLRKKLEITVIKAREVAEQAAFEALTRLSVGEAKAADYLDDQQRALRNRLRAHGRQLGDERNSNGQQQIERLRVEIAYEHWHRMLFARFLEQSHLLMYDQHTALTLDECQELAPDEGCANGWELAGKLASRMLPQVFREGSPALSVPLAFNHVRDLEKLIAGLDAETFQASDSLGWVYQYWQTKKKDEVNSSGVKIGADELSTVTQLFTEPYMVQFLLDNSLGAWWVTNYPQYRNLLPLTYLRTVYANAEAASSASDFNAILPAAGTFHGWPENLADFRMLDPCCGSGHFLVATFLMLVPMRMAAECLDADQAIDAVLSQNLHGLELDQRCVELAAFAVALEAWRYPQGSGYRSLPELNIACVGQRIRTPRDQWLALTGDNPELKAGMARLYDTFSDAPILGSLIDPARSLEGDLLTADWAEVQPLLTKALTVAGEEEDLHEAAITAQGLARAAEMLDQRYQLVITNVPYLARGKQANTLKDFSERYYDFAKNDLANVFLERCLELVATSGTVQVVMPQNWLFLGSYKKQREKLLKSVSWSLVALLGAKSFQTPMWDFNVQLLTLNNELPPEAFLLRGMDASGPSTAQEKAEVLQLSSPISISQRRQLLNPDARVSLVEAVGEKLLEEYALALAGINTGDYPRWGRTFWEFSERGSEWELQQTTSTGSSLDGGLTQAVRWCNGEGDYLEYIKSLEGRLGGSWRRGVDVWGKTGVAVSQMSALPVSRYAGSAFDSNVSAVVPKDQRDVAAIYAFCSSEEFSQAVRRIDQKVNVTNATFAKVPFDLAHWQLVAAELFPNGLPKPYSDDPTQWIFHGHPQPASNPLQVAVARLLGYRWPVELDDRMELSDEALAWNDLCPSLTPLVDDDGIVCLPPVRGEKSAAARLEYLLEAAFGSDWSAPCRNKLLDEVGAKSLDAWLFDKFFEQHCKLFHHRPFIWHVWDGLKDGFGALVNYHKLNRANLERLIFTYLGDWIRTQQHGVEQKLDGADARLAAAQNLKSRLELILEGEAPYDIFVRWKSLAEQAIGWDPDFNDGVRLNIRPFMTAEVLRHNKKPKLNIEWKKDRGNDVPSAPWFTLGLQYGEKEGARINDHHLKLAEKKKA
ncbi:Eco57I restriction-modification methylase domain-containing protein [Pseudomonas sp. P1.8]|uniref:Eco57I restriction-modification methylase domain-containing protein n=1 Tax=Pseudomonas sp. P1.8 TaxID=1699310 RepID=UPI00069F6C36|nr:N-6 DNA methylase [Pseudomonas sp. P1.8]